MESDTSDPALLFSFLHNRFAGIAFILDRETVLPSDPWVALPSGGLLSAPRMAARPADLRDRDFAQTHLRRRVQNKTGIAVRNRLNSPSEGSFSRVAQLGRFRLEFPSANRGVIAAV